MAPVAVGRACKVLLCGAASGATATVIYAADL